MAEDQDSRTEDPTGKRVSQARGRGQVAMSKEATTLIILTMTTRPAVRICALAIMMDSLSHKMKQ